MACAFAGSMAVFSESNCRLIRFLSGISYEIYLFHGLVIYILKLIGVERYPWIFLFITIIGTIVFATPAHILHQYVIGKILFSKKEPSDVNMNTRG